MKFSSATTITPGAMLFDANKSTKGASKLRRDLINSEIANLRDLLPLPQSTRQRLSQLQLMALVCVYVRKANYFQQVFKRSIDIGLHSAPTPNIGFSKALSGFLMMLTQNGKLLYISDNAAEYLGHSMEDLLIHGDSVYDIIDKQDHGAIQSELSRGVSQHPAGGGSLAHHHHHHHHQQQQQLGAGGVPGGSSSTGTNNATSNSNHHHHHSHHQALHQHHQTQHHQLHHHHHHLHHHGGSLSPSSSSAGSSATIGGGGPSAGSSLLDGEQRIFLCRMNVSRNARRQMRFGDQKVVLVQGHYLSYLPLCSRNEPVFIATCTPIAMPETRECVVQGATNVFTTIHSMDMKVVHIDKNGEFHLGYSRSELQGVSWYQLLHWESTREAQSKHRLITQSEQDRSCILLVRMQRRQNDFLWVHVVLQVRDGQDSNQQSVIVCTNQVLSDREASVMLSNSWLYHYYTVQSKMQFGIPFEGATRIPPSGSYAYGAAALGNHSNHSPGGAGSGGVGQTGTGSSSGGVITAAAASGLGSHSGYSASHSQHHLTGYGFHASPSGQHHNGGPATPMMHGHHPHLQHQHQAGVTTTASAGDEYGTTGRPYGFRLESGSQPVDYSGGQPTPPTSAPPPGMGNPVAIPIPVVQVTPHIRCHNGGGGSSATSSDRHNGTPPTKKRNVNRLEPLHIPDSGPPESPETSGAIGDYHQHAGAGQENGGPPPGDLHGLGNGLGGSIDAGGGGGGGGLQAMLVGPTISSSRTTLTSRLHSKSAILPPTVTSGLGGEPTDFMEQWNPSPPWSDTTAQKVPDITHQELSPYMTTTPPTPTSAPHQLLGGGFPTATTFSFDWMPEQFVPIVTDCAVGASIAHHHHHPGTILPVTQTIPSSSALTCITSHGAGSSSTTSTGSMAHHGPVGSCLLPASCLTQDGLPIPGMAPLPMPVPLQIPPPPWPSDHRLLTLDGHPPLPPPPPQPPGGEHGVERKQPLDEATTRHEQQQQQH
ncbi:uncharacterized protein LOC128269838 [Anopheles cruzii]|uniref:uncharacterized protein LOC128269838 n=1 Tax=Anopheles cruzii TaxID=68878 RepID=UPI0022EC871F|nr:uncharacterized protein LOC128269838 [Anopheles cruzii]